MKRILSTIALVAFVATAFVSCDKSEVEAPETGVKMKTITVKTDLTTKTTLDANHENLVWSEGDKISIFNNVGNQNYEAAYVAGGDLTVEVPETTTEIYAHYPYFSGNTNGPESVSVYISKDQTQTNPGELNGRYYPMVAKGTVSADNKALISLYPVASALALNIYNTELTGSEQVKSVTVTPASANTKFTGSQNTDITGEDIKYTEAADSDPITVTLTTPLTLGNTKPADKQKFAGQIYVCLAKQSYANVKFEITTDKGTYTILSNNTPFDCVNNDFVPVNINLKNATFEGPLDPTTFSWTLVKDALTVGDKVVIAASASSVAMSTTQNNNNRGQIAVTKSGNALTANANVQVFEVVSGSVSSSFAFKCLNGEEKGKYIAAASSSSNNMHSNASIDANASWGVTINSSTGVAEVVAKGSYSRNTLQHNSSSKLFSCYSSASQAAVVFYRAGLPSANLSFPEESYSVNLGEIFTAPTLANPNSVSVTYSSSNTAVATVDASTGAVSLADVGTTTITASFEGNSIYAATSASYELVVIDPDAVDYVTLPWSYPEGDASATSEGISNIAGVIVSGLGSDYAADHAPYQIKLDSTGDYFQIKTDSAIGSVSISYKMIGGANASSLVVSESSDGETWTNVETLTISGNQNNTGVLTTTNNFAAASRYVKIVFTKGSNVGIGGISITKPNNKLDPGLAWSAATGTATINGEEVTTDLPTLTNGHGLTVTYASSDATVASVDGTGAVTPLKSGTTTISASFAGDETYKAATVSYTLTVTVVIVDGDVFTLYSGNLVEGDYIIYYNGKAMNTTVSSDRLQYAEVTPLEDKITTSEASIVWHIAQSGNYWTIYNAEADAFAASTGAKNKAQMLSDGTDDKALWTVSGTETFDFVNKKNTANGVNATLRNNASYGFACYASSTGGALTLYKKN